MKTVIHVNQHIIKANRKHGHNDPPLTIKTYKENRKAHEVVVHGPCRIVHADPARGIKPLPCGARVWVETTAPVEVVA